jgi:hypothetical protein
MNRILRASLPKWMVRNAGDRELVGSDKISRYVDLDTLEGCLALFFVIYTLASHCV